MELPGCNQEQIWSVICGGGDDLIFSKYMQIKLEQFLAVSWLITYANGNYQARFLVSLTSGSKPDVSKLAALNYIRFLD